MRLFLSFIFFFAFRNGAIVAVEAAKDLSFGEIEAVYNLQEFLQRDAIVVQGLHYSDDIEGIKLTLAVVGGTILTPEEIKLEEEELAKIASAEKDRKIAMSTKQSAWLDSWEKFKKWF